MTEEQEANTNSEDAVKAPLQTLDEVFKTDPLKLTDEDLDRIAAKLVEDQRAFKAGQKVAKRNGTRTPRAPKTKVSLADLGL